MSKKNCKNVNPTESYQLDTESYQLDTESYQLDTESYQRDQEVLIQNQAQRALNKPPRNLEPASLRVVMESYDPSLNESIKKDI